MDNLPLLLIIGLAVLYGGYALYEQAGPTKCQQCGRRGGNKLVSTERLPDTSSDSLFNQFQDTQYTVRLIFRCPHCGYEYSALEERIDGRHPRRRRY